MPYREIGQRIIATEQGGQARARYGQALIARLTDDLTRRLPIINTGTIEGGNGASAVMSQGASTNIALVNSGTVRAGAGQPNAIALVAGSTGAITLALQAESVIDGNVIAN